MSSGKIFSMRRKLWSQMAMIGILAVLITAFLCVFLFYETFSEQAHVDLRTNAGVIAAAYSETREAGKLEKYAINGTRITLIAATGQVLFESGANKDVMENHMSRPEVLGALQGGSGEAMRQSATVGYNTYYYALLLEDGNILRVAVNAADIYSTFVSTLPAIIGVIVFIVLAAAFVSMLLTRKLVHPITAMADNLDDIDTNIPYRELERFAQTVKEQQRKKSENERARREFTANVSHELKTPLTSISGYAEMMMSGMVREEDIKNFSGKIHSEAARLITLIGDIIKLSELDEPAVYAVFEPVDLFAIANEIVKLLAFSADKSGVVIIIRGEACLVTGNRSMLSELIYNLCDNAVRYNKKNGRVIVSVQRREDGILLTVDDTGIGMAQEHLSRVFERFYRVDKSRSKQTGGTGLGLAIVKHIAIQHGANISLESRVDAGTKVSVLFPSAPANTPEMGRPE